MPKKEEDIALKKIKEEFERNIDPLELSASYYPHLTPLFFAQLGLKNASELERNIPSNIRMAADFGLNELKGLFIDDKDYQKWLELPNVEKRAKEKGARIIFNTTHKNFQNLSNIISLLTATSTIAGASALTVGAVSGFGLAAGAWAASVFSAIQLKRAVKKYRDPNCWIMNKLHKYTAVNNKIKRLDDMKIQLLQAFKSEQSQDKKRKLKVKIIKVNHKIKLAEKHKIHLQEDTVAIAHVYANKLKDGTIDKISKLYDEYNQRKSKNNIQDIISLNEFIEKSIQNPNPETKKIIGELQKNQREVITRRTIDTISYVTMAVGLTLTAISPFAGPGAPALMAAGMLITGIGTAIKLGYTLGEKLVHQVAQSKQFDKEKKELLEEYGKSLDVYVSAKTPEEKLRFKLSFEHAKNDFRSNPANKDLSDTELEKRWYAMLQQQDKEVRKSILESAEKKAINTRILKKALAPEISNDKFMEVSAQLSEKSKEQIVKRYNRLVLKKSIKSSLVKKKSNIKNALLRRKKLGPRLSMA